MRTLKVLLAIRIIAWATFADVEINSTNFPDANFRAWALEQDWGSDGNLTDAEIAEITSIDVSSKNISDLTGIGNFTALTSLYCYSNQLTSLNVSTNTALKYLYCQNNLLPELSISTNTLLEYLECSDNQLTALNVSSNTALTRLWCKNNQLNELNISSNTALRYLDCYNNELTALNILSNTLLTSLDCHNNQLIELNLSENTALATLDCSNNKLTELDISNNVLTNLNCSYNYIPEAKLPAEPEVIVSWTITPQYTEIPINQITFPDANFRAWALSQTWASDSLIIEAEIDTIKSINVSYKSISNLKGIEYFTALTALYCYRNQLTSLDVSKNTSLTILNCTSNQLTELDVSSNTALTNLTCQSNQLTALDMSNNPALTILYCDSNKLTTLNISNNPALTILQCDSNKLTTLNVSNNSALTSLNCQSNKLIELDVSNNSALTSLQCHLNRLAQLDVSLNTALTYLDCNSNKLTSLDVSLNTELTNLNCRYNYIPEANVPAKPDGVNENDWITTPQNTGVPINETTFPDANFRAWALSQTWGSDSLISTSEVETITSIDVSIKEISNLKGIEYFTALTYLDCYDNKLTSLDVSLNTELTSLNCSSNQLDSLDVSSNIALTYLGCDDNQLDSLDVTNNTALISFGCYNNQLTSLDVSSNTELRHFSCSGNQLTELDVYANTELTDLDCSNNQLTELDVYANTELIWLDCSNNQLIFFEYTIAYNKKNLAHFDCSYNYIHKVDIPVNDVVVSWVTLPQYIVAVFMNGEEKHDSTKITTASGTISKPADPTKTGYTFDGWYKEKALTNLWDFDTDEFTGMTTLYAGFTPIEYTITWNVEGNETTTDVAYDATPVFDGTPSKTSTAKYSYTFKNWSPAIAAVSGAQTYTAIFDSTVREYTITWSINGDATTTDFEYGTTPTFDGTPTKTSPYKYIYTFSGWSPEVATVVGNQTYTAVFDSTIRKHTVTFECNGGTAVEPQSIEYEGKIAIPANPTKDGYSFAGWHEGDTLFDMESAITRHITLTAEWDETVAINKPQKDSRFGIKFAQNIVSTTAEISVVLPNGEKAVKAEIVVYDAIGNIVFVSEGSKGRPESPLTVWNLTNKAGRTVANGTYLVIAEVKGLNGMSYHYSAKLGVKR